jgi:hypothetical protein
MSSVMKSMNQLQYQIEIKRAESDWTSVVKLGGVLVVYWKLQGQAESGQRKAGPAQTPGPSV